MDSLRLGTPDVDLHEALLVRSDWIFYGEFLIATFDHFLGSKDRTLLARRGPLLHAPYYPPPDWEFLGLILCQFLVISFECFAAYLGVMVHSPLQGVVVGGIQRHEPVCLVKVIIV